MTQVVTRIAPSPTGDMHIGTARTALFNYLYAKHTGGKFVLRVEDTDSVRSTEAAVKVIFDGLKWLGLDFDGDAVFQSTRADRHREVVESMLAAGTAYKCYVSPEDAAKMKTQGSAFRSPYRDPDYIHNQGFAADEHDGVPFVVRFKSPMTGDTTVHDLVKGDVKFSNATFDDLVLLRSDGTPTYNLAVVVDDHDMGITHVIRGDDHLNNTGRQTLLYVALEWPVPSFGHIPLIFNEQGKKLSKRDGAASIMDFRNAGYLPETMRNYLARLGWGHGEDEIFTDAQAIEWFDVVDVVSAPARMNAKKLLSVNHHYIVAADNDRLADLVVDFLGFSLHADERARLPAVIGLVKEGAHTLVELAGLCSIAYLPTTPDEKAAAVLADPDVKDRLSKLKVWLLKVVDWTPETLNASIREFSTANDIPMGKIGPGMRVALTGRLTAPDLGTCLALVGPDRAFTCLNLATA